MLPTASVPGVFNTRVIPVRVGADAPEEMLIWSKEVVLLKSSDSVADDWKLFAVIVPTVPALPGRSRAPALRLRGPVKVPVEPVEMSVPAELTVTAPLAVPLSDNVPPPLTTTAFDKVPAEVSVPLTVTVPLAMPETVSDPARVHRDVAAQSAGRARGFGHGRRAPEADDQRLPPESAGNRQSRTGSDRDVVRKR